MKLSNAAHSALRALLYLARCPAPSATAHEMAQGVPGGYRLARSVEAVRERRPMDWNAVNAIGSVSSAAIFLISALYVRAQLRAAERDRFLNVTNQLYTIWESADFMQAQFWLLHQLQEKTWPAFVQAHRGGVGEAAFYRVGSFYNRVGSLVRLELINRDEMLTTVGAFAIAVWQKIEPLVREARQREHSTLFLDFEQMLPACYECYVPTASPRTAPQRWLLSAPVEPVPRITVEELRQRLDRAEPLTLLDVRRPEQQQAEPATLPSAVRMPPDQVVSRRRELPAGREVVLYCA